MEINTTDEFIECPTCEGTGKEAFEDDSFQSPSVKYAPCQECHGEKKVENAEYCPEEHLEEVNTMIKSAKLFKKAADELCISLNELSKLIDELKKKQIKNNENGN